MDPYRGYESPVKTPFDPLPSTESRKGCGCLTMFLVGMVCCFLACAGLCGGVYYWIFHSSYPLKQIAEMLESSGDVEVEGLTGSISKGFHIDRLRFRDEGEDWSTLEQIDFEFNGVWNLVSEQRLIVDRLTVGSGEIYVNFSDESEGGGDPDGGTVDEDPGNLEDLFGDPSEEADSTADVEHDVEGLKEIRIDLVEFSNIKFIDKATRAESKLGRIAVKDLHYLDGEFQSVAVAEIENVVARGENFEVTDLSGSTDSGFQAKQIRFRTGEGDWSHLDQLTFEFNGVADLVENQRLVIDRFSIAGGTIYCELDDLQADSAGNEDEDEPASEPADESGNGHSQLKELRIDLIHLPNLELVNAASGVRFRIDEISIKDLHYTGNQVTHLGDLNVVADHLEFRDGPSERFSDQPESAVTRNFSGIVRATMHEGILADIPFDIDVCFAGDGEFRTHIKLCDEKMVYDSDGGDHAEVVFRDFTFADYVKWKYGPLPSHVDGEVTVVADADDPKQATVTIAPEATFRLGDTPFTVETEQIEVNDTTEVSPPLAAIHRSAAGEIRCRVYGLKQAPFWAIDLQSDDPSQATELYARVLYGKSFESLTNEQRSSIEEMLKTVQGIGQRP